MGKVEHREDENKMNMGKNREVEHDACGIGAVVHIDGRKDYEIVDQALHIVEKLEHRAGKDKSGEVGDGVGILLQISHNFFKKVAKQQGIALGEEKDYAVGMFFFPQDRKVRNHAIKIFENLLSSAQMECLGWREVPHNDTILGAKAKDCMPFIMQCFIKKGTFTKQGLEFEKALYVVRRELEKSSLETYVVSLSSNTIVYKGMFLVNQLRQFYTDLQDHDYHSAIALVHSRFSTNTNPSWNRAHPNRMIAHNGEINTIQGNANRMLAREEVVSSPFCAQNKEVIFPIVDMQGSDSAMLDNTLEFLYMNGVDIAKAMMMLIPEPWKHTNMPAKKKDFYHYYSTMMEPWDGPAAILFSDGERVGAMLDRNGLRPARYYILEDQTLVLSSEVGVLDIDESKIIKKSRLEPGKMLLVDTKAKQLIEDEQCKLHYASQYPYNAWLANNLLYLKDLIVPKQIAKLDTQVQTNQLYKLFAYTYEDVNDVILPMALNSKEPLTSMGADIPLALLSKHHPLLFHYFKQQFAQVTNPPIDSLREKVVVDTTVYVGTSGNLLLDQECNCRVIEINNPILDKKDMDKLKYINAEGFKSKIISLLFYKGTNLKNALDDLFLACDRAFYSGVNIFILSDKGVDENHLAIPSLLAVAALKNHLLKNKIEMQVSIILESGEVRDVHQFACLLGYGAKAIYPYLAHECIQEVHDLHMLNTPIKEAIENYNQAILQGIVKIAAKMGVSTIQSYQSAQIFESVGLREDFIQTYFTNTIASVGAIGLEDIEHDIRHYHESAFNPLQLESDSTLDSVGFHKYRSGKKAEEHLYNPKSIVLLQRATRENNYDLFKQFTNAIYEEDKPVTIRHLLEFDNSQRKAISIEEVESVESIVKRFKTGAMSYGSISQEAHECMAEAMNRLGGKSNSGEGGEDPKRLHTIKNSAIKQVASGRFGVTSEYLMSANEIQIKMAQGAKPGEGGHLPGQKVYPWIAKTRYSTPGVSLISPPPHHDIYSIEDLAQLIFDLKNANREARISVKLVSKSGVGTIASGVAKAGANVVVISGYDGGTGAASQSSIHHAGMPWEIGLLDAHRVLASNGLRSRVVLETDGKLMSGKDVAIAALFGAEEFGFATAPLVVMGCVMMRVCNLDTCPVGVATQNECLRKKFKGKPEYVMNFMRFIAQELREIMASLGFSSVDEMIGHSECLKVKNHVHESIDLSQLLAKEPLPIHYQEQDQYPFELHKTLDLKYILPAFEKALKEGKPQSISVAITSTDRSVGTIFGSEITKRYKNTLNDDTYCIHCVGGAGQSFGAFIPKGLTMKVEGDANDYFAKGLSGGKVVVYPSSKATFKASENVIVGNVAMYGATAGEVYICGQAGERFAVRNSGATAVVEGCGDHALEYMTGGVVAILGKTGKNLAAGMSGGVAYVLDELLDVNSELVAIEHLGEEEKLQLKQLITTHVEQTNSQLGNEILTHYEKWVQRFKKIIPHDYKKMITMIADYEKQGYQSEEAKLKAFHTLYNE